MDKRTHDRMLGCFMGLAVGDAVGSPNEFRARDARVIHTMEDGGFNGLLKAGMWTDDTSMALCLAESMIEHDGAIIESDLIKRWRAWQKRGRNSSLPGRPAFDIGIGTSRALTARPAARPAVAKRNSGNGGIMRLAPAVVWPGTRAQAIDRAVQQSIPTHASDDALYCAIELAMTIHEAADGIKPKWFANNLYSLERHLRDVPRHDVESTGYCIDTLNAARWCVYHTQTFEHAVLAAANLGDDADSVAAVTGQIAGALYGFDAIPTKWLTDLYECDRLYDIGQKLIYGEA